MAAAKGYTSSVTYVIYASPEKVFDALTLEGIIGEWCEGGGVVSPQPGDKVRLFGDWVKGTVLKFNRKKGQLSYTWKPSEWDKKTAESVVDFVFRNHPAGTEVTVEHTHFPTQTEADKHAAGWVDYVFEPLNDYFTR